MRKRLFCFLFVGAMVLSLAACGQQNQNDEQPQNRQDNEQPQAADTQALPSQTASVGEKTTEPDVVQTSGGLVQGTDEDGIYRFLGIPYATVKERFVPAGEVEPWDGIYQADSYGPMAPQDSSSGTDNNCQNLNHRRVHSPMLCIVTCFIRGKRVI